MQHAAGVVEAGTLLIACAEPAAAKRRSVVILHSGACIRREAEVGGQHEHVMAKAGTPLTHVTNGSQRGNTSLCTHCGGTGCAGRCPNGLLLSAGRCALGAGGFLGGAAALPSTSAAFGAFLVAASTGCGRVCSKKGTAQETTSIWWRVDAWHTHACRGRAT